jgi:type IV secretory pathway VirB2 component (pilin)
MDKPISAISIRRMRSTISMFLSLALAVHAASDKPEPAESAAKEAPAAKPLEPIMREAPDQAG